MKIIKLTTLIISCICLTLFTSCSDDDDDDAVTPVVTTPLTNNSNNNNNSENKINELTSAGFVGYLDGDRIEMIVALDSDLEANVGSGGTEGATSTKSYQSGVFHNTDWDGFTLSIGEITYAGSTPSNSVFQSLFNVGSVDYSIEAKNGVSLSVYFGPNDIWSTSEGAADQTGSTFEFTEVNYSGSTVEVKAKFSCTVYDGNGNSKQLTEGEYIGIFQPV